MNDSRAAVKVQLLTFEDCPLADAARASLDKALADCGIEGYEEIDILDPSVSDEQRQWGSPTILIDGTDVTGQRQGDGVGCRVYSTPEESPMRNL